MEKVLEKVLLWGHDRFGFFIIWFITQLFILGTEIRYIVLYILVMLVFSTIAALVNPTFGDMKYDEKGFPKRKKFFRYNFKYYFTVISFFSMLIFISTPVSESILFNIN